MTFAQQKLIDTNASPFYTNEGEHLMRVAVKLTYDYLRGAHYPEAPATTSFLGKLSALSGLDFDLPGDAEWEYVAKAGLPQDLWPNGKIRAPGTRVDDAGNTIATDANFPGRYKGNSYPNDETAYGAASKSWPAQYGAPIVGSYEPSIWGIYDMVGCVWEIPRDITVNSQGASQCYLRGGAWSKDATGCLPSTQATSTLSNGSDYIGARVACPVGF